MRGKTFGKAGKIQRALQAEDHDQRGGEKTCSEEEPGRGARPSRGQEGEGKGAIKKTFFCARRK